MLRNPYFITSYIDFTTYQPLYKASPLNSNCGRVDLKLAKNFLSVVYVVTFIRPLCTVLELVPMEVEVKLGIALELQWFATNVCIVIMSLTERLNVDDDLIHPRGIPFESRWPKNICSLSWTPKILTSTPGGSYRPRWETMNFKTILIYTSAQCIGIIPKKLIKLICKK